MGENVYIYKKKMNLGIEELLFVSIVPNWVPLKEEGYEVEELDEDVAFPRAMELIRRFEQGEDKDEN